MSFANFISHLVEREPETLTGHIRRIHPSTFEVFLCVLFFSIVTAPAVSATDQTAARHLVPQDPPPATGAELHYAIREELPVGSPVADIVADAGLHVHGVDAVRGFQFRLINQQQYPMSSSSLGPVGGFNSGGTGPGGGVFAIGESTGVVRVGARLDRESICPSTSPTSVEHSWRCVVRLDIAVQPMAYFQIVKVFVEIMDINDNEPEFRPNTRIIELSESTPIGAVVLLPLAIDPDIGQNGVQRYELTTGVDGVVEGTGDDKSDIGNVATTARGRHGPRRPAVPSVSPTAAVRPGRGGRNRLETPAAVPFNLTTARKSDGSTEVKLVVTGALDRETKDRYRVRVTAYDGGRAGGSTDGGWATAARSGTLDLTIIVLDANDNGPVFEREAYVVTLLENSPRGTRVTQVRATDADIGDNGRVVYQLQLGVGRTPSNSGSGSRSLKHGDNGGGTFAIDEQTGSRYSKHGDNGGGTFAIDEQTGIVSVLNIVDFESHPSGYRLLVTARDCGSPEPRSADALITIRIEDINDNPPTVRVNTIRVSDAERASVPEDAGPETFVAHVIATDADGGENGRVECRLGVEQQLQQHRGTTAGADPQLYFRLIDTHDAEYHLVTSGLPLDRELHSSYDVELICSDAGVPPLTTVRRLEVDVTDINDNSPYFDRPIYHAELLENNYIGVFITQLNATDLDEGPNSLIHYRLADNEDDKQSTSGMFAVDPISGTLTANAVLDRERTSRYRIRVLAIDAGLPEPRTGSATVVLDVLDVDDELPHFSTHSYGFTVDENQPVGVSVGRLTAVDADAPPFNRFYFRFRPFVGSGVGDGNEAFAIDRWTGVIVTTRLLDREQRDAYELIAEVISDTTLSSDEWSHHSDESSFAAVVSGFSSTATVVIRVLDANDNQPEFINTDNFIEVAGLHDHESADVTRHDDDGEVSRTADEEANKITMIVSNRSVRGQGVAEVKAIDTDEGDNGTIDYSIVAGNEQQLFTIDSHLGIVRLNVNFAGNQDNRVHSLVVMATDRGIPTRLSSAIRLLLVVNETSTPSYPAITSDRRPSGQQLQSQTVHGRRQATPSSSSGNAAIQTGHGRNVGRHQPTPMSSTSASIVLVGAACGSGFVLVAVLVAVTTFVLRRRRLHQIQLRPMTLVGMRTSVSHRCSCCCCCHGDGINDAEVAAKNGSASGTSTAVYTVDAGSPIKQLTVSGRKLAASSTTTASISAAKPHVRLVCDDVIDDVWVGVGSFLPVVSTSQPDVLPASTTASPEAVCRKSVGRVRSSSSGTDRTSTVLLPTPQRRLEQQEDHLGPVAVADSSAADDDDLAEDGSVGKTKSNIECLRRIENSVPGEVQRLLQCQHSEVSAGGIQMTSLSHNSSTIDTQPIVADPERLGQRMTYAGSKVNGGMATMSLRRSTTLQTPSYGHGPTARCAKYNKAVPPPPPPPQRASFHDAGGNPPASSYCRYHCFSASGSSGAAAPAAGCVHRNVSGCRKSTTLDRRSSPTPGRGFLCEISNAASNSPSSSVNGRDSDDTPRHSRTHTSLV